MTQVLGSRFELDSWLVLPDRGLLRGPDGDVHLEPKVMGVLVFLAERQGETVRRDELLDNVWSGTIVTDEVLSRAISVLRQALGDDRISPRFIQTLPKIGYRLIAPVKPVTESQPPGWRHWGTKRNALVILAAVALLFVLSHWLQPEKPVIDPNSPAAFAEIADWFDFLGDKKAGTANAVTIAVLPWRQLTDDLHYQYLGENLTDEVMVALNRVKGLRVLSRPAALSYRYRENDPTPGQIQGVDVVLEGSVRPDEGEVRFTAQLSDVAEGYLIWSDTFVLPADELFGLKESMAAQVVEALCAQYPESELALPQTSLVSPDSEAYRVYLATPNFLTNMRGERPLRQSIEQYRAALAIDREFTRASIGLATSLVLLPFYSNEPMEPSFRLAEESLRDIALTEDRDRGEVEAIRGFMAWNRWQWLEAEERFRRALDLAPDVANIYQWYSQHLAHVGRKRDSLAAAIKASELDNVSPPVIDRLGVAHLWLDDNLKAAEQFAISSRLGFKDTNNPVYLLLYLRTGQLDRFRRAMQAFHSGSGYSTSWITEHADLLLDPGDFREFGKIARQAYEQGQAIQPRLILPLWLYLGDNDQAYRTVESFSRDGRQYLPMEMIFAREGQKFRRDSRFDDLADEIGWTAYWKAHGGPDKN